MDFGKEAAERVSASCYGAIVAASTLASSADVAAGRLILLVVATNLVYYGTHVFALHRRRQPGTEATSQIAAHHGG